MSRTDKDRPYWVVVNDETIDMRYVHDYHTLDLIGINYYSIYDIHSEYCTAYDRGIWTARNLPRTPCFREPIVDKRGWWKLPKIDRSAPYRARRRDFLKNQVKIFNSQYGLHDGYDFMNEEVYEPFTNESSHSHWQK
jgi:hypothetical protein